jgi:hypothetical protein
VSGVCDVVCRSGEHWPRTPSTDSRAALRGVCVWQPTQHSADTVATIAHTPRIALLGTWTSLARTLSLDACERPTSSQHARVAAAAASVLAQHEVQHLLVRDKRIMVRAVEALSVYVSDRRCCIACTEGDAAAIGV